MTTSTAIKPAASDEAAELGALPTSRPSATVGAASRALGAATDVAGDAVARLPGLAETGRAAIEDANRRIHAGSDEMLATGTAVAFGLAVGLLIGGASRLLVAAALVPVGMMGLAVLDRASRGTLRGSATLPSDR